MTNREFDRIIRAAVKRCKDFDHIDGMPHASLPFSVQVGAIQSAVATGIRIGYVECLADAYVLLEQLRTVLKESGL